jgi:hypothetical protein
MTARAAAAMPECVSERGRGTDERDEWHGEEVDLDFRFLQPGALRRVLAGAGLVVEATLEREPIAGRRGADPAGLPPGQTTLRAPTAIETRRPQRLSRPIVLVFRRRP